MDNFEFYNTDQMKSLQAFQNFQEYKIDREEIKHISLDQKSSNSP